MHKHKDRKYRTAASLAVTVVLSAAIFLLFFSIELLIGYFSSHSFRESLRISGYAEGMEEELLTKQKALFSSYGLPESLTEEIWGGSKAYLAFSQYADDGISKKDGADFGQQAVLEEYIQSQDIYETESVQEAIKAVVSESGAICRRYVYPSFIRGYRQFIQERRPLFLGMAIVSVIAGALCVFLLFRWYHCRHHALYYITGSCFTAAAWNLAATAVIRTGGWFAVSGVQAAYYQKFIDVFKTRGITPFYIFSIVTAALAVLLLVVSIRMRNRK